MCGSTRIKEQPPKQRMRDIDSTNTKATPEHQPLQWLKKHQPWFPGGVPWALFGYSTLVGVVGGGGGGGATTNHQPIRPAGAMGQPH